MHAFALTVHDACYFRSKLADTAPLRTFFRDVLFTFSVPNILIYVAVFTLQAAKPAPKKAAAAKSAGIEW